MLCFVLRLNRFPGICSLQGICEVIQVHVEKNETESDLDIKLIKFDHRIAESICYLLRQDYLNHLILYLSYQSKN